VFVLFGCVAAALLALAVDQLLALMETGAARRSPRRVTAGAAGLGLLLAAALMPALGRPSADYVIGAKPFSEQYVLAALIQQRLVDAGLSAGRRDGLGSAIIFDALRNGEIDAYVEYTGTIWANQMHRSDVKPRDDVLREVAAWLKENGGIAVAAPLGFENAYALAMSKKRADALGIHSIADLARHAPTLTIAGDYEFFGRPEWTALRKTYGLQFKGQRTMQAEFMYPAAEAGEVDVIAAYTSDGRITRHGMIVLDDPKGAIPPYDAIVLVSPRRANDPALLAALRPLAGAINVELMRAANLRATEAGTSAEDVARWLAAQIAQQPPRQPK
jgi:osmoprotectant transport system permease protein